MAPIIPIQPAIAILTPGDQDDLESNIGASAQSSTSSVNDTSDHVDERDSIVGQVKGGCDTAAQVVASVWSRNQLITGYGLIWFVIAVCSIFDNVLNALGPYVASAFHLHSYAAATGIVASIVGGLSPVPTSKLLQKVGRAQGLSIMLTFWIVGLVMLAACQNVSTFAAAQVFTAIGSTGVSYCISVFVADTTSLRNRGFMMSFSTSPQIITMWISGPIASALLTGIGWRWGFGIFSIALPLATLPFITLVLWNQRKAFRTGLLPRKTANKIPDTPESAFSTLKRIFLQIDLPGLFILLCGLSLFLLPFTLYSFQDQGFGSPLIASSIAVGLALIIGYVLYERYLAPTQSLPFALLRDRTILLAILTEFLSIFAFVQIIGYGTSYLQVVTNLNVTQTSYIISAITVAICVWTLILGAIVRWTGRLKILVLAIGIPLMTVAAGLFLHFRHPSNNSLAVMIGIIVLVSFALGTTSLCVTLILMAALGQEHITTVLALITFVSNAAPAIGEAVNTGIWTGTFKRALHQHLPSITPEEVNGIYSSLTVQLSFPKGSAVREGIALAYGDAKFYMLVTSLCFLSLAMISTLFWKDLRTTEMTNPQVAVVGASTSISRRGSTVGAQ